MSNSNEETKVSPAGRMNPTVITLAVLICATVLGAIYLVGESKDAARPVPAQNLIAEPVVQRNPVEGFVTAALRKSEGGQVSAEYYIKFLSEQVLCQMTAGSIRNMVERVDISPSKPDVLGHQYPSPNAAGVRKALEVASSYYKRSVRNKLGLSSAGIDPAIVSYVEKFAAFDQTSGEAYERYASTLQSEAREIDAIGKLRDELVEKEEASLIAGFEKKYGIKLPTRRQLRESALKIGADESRQFLEKKSPQELAANLLGNSFINANDFGRWTVEAGEYVFGRVSETSAGCGIAIVDLEVQLKGARSGNPGLVRARIAYVKDPVRSVYWPVLVHDLSAR